LLIEREAFAAMAEPTLKEQENSSPYDLWPDERSAPRREEPFAAPFAEQIPAIDDTPFAQPFAPASEPVGAEPSRPSSETPFDAPFVPVVYTPETTEENVRNAGLAWSAGVVFFGSVVFMLFLGWIADLLLGSSPWGIVIGIVLGAVIGFIQFFRISSQIYAPKNSQPKSLMSDHNED
jgi:F0F1-type ATP synthase assembly protein I